MVRTQAYTVGLWFFFSLAPTHAFNLRGQGRNISDVKNNNNGRVLQPAESFCYCEGCTASALERMADGHSCGNRMSWLQEAMGLSEVDACRVVAGVEFPDKCGACDPAKCQAEQICGEVPTCTVDVLSTMACDDSKGGCSQCGERIKYLLASGVSSSDACHQVAVEEFPSECGLCAAATSVAQTEPPTSSPTKTPTPSPTFSPTAMPTPPSSPAMCGGVSTCTQAVLDTEACDPSLYMWRSH